MIRPNLRLYFWLTLLTITALTACRGFGASPVCLSGARMASTGECQSQRAPLHHLPFREGFETRIQQGYHGYVSHKEDLAYAYDFRCDEGTPVTASRSGRVWDVREDSNHGCDDPSCVEDANYIILDHGDGTFSEYYHLRHLGAIVEPGETVCRGQVIGLCGNTGYSTGPHLHFAVTDATRHTIPSRFPEAHRRGWGFPVPETTYRSENRRLSTCRPPDYSSLDADAFAHQGITLDEPLPIVITDRERPIELAGTYFGGHPMISVHRKALNGASWTDECIPVDHKGRFRGRVAWPSSRFPDGAYWLMITGADEDCYAPGWSWSYKIFIRS